MIKKVCDFALEKNIFQIYTTIFPKHKNLIDLLKRYGFLEYGKKDQETVMVKIIPTKIEEIRNNISHDFPAVKIANTKKFLLSIHPKFHTLMFADSKLKTEESDVLQDCSRSNSIHKIYITNMNGIENLKPNDLLIIYRTKDENAKNANYSAVATSLCVVEEYRNIKNFSDQNDFLKYCKEHSVFTENELIGFYSEKKFLKIIKMTYNVSFKKRVVLDTLRKILAYKPAYWGFFELSNDHFEEILKEGMVNDSIIIN